MVRVERERNLERDTHTTSTKFTVRVCVCVCLLSRSLVLRRTRVHEYIVQLLLAASTTFCPFIHFSLILSLAGVFFDIYIYIFSAMYMCVRV